MLDLGPHAGFIVAAYAVTFVGFAALILATVGDDRRQQQRLAQLERQGIRRRSAPQTQPAKTQATKKPAPKTRTRAAKAQAAKKSPARKTETRKTAPKRPRANKTPA